MSDTLTTETAVAANTLVMYTTSWCGDCIVTKRALTKLEVPFREVNIEEDPAAAAYVMQVNGGRRSVPTLVYNGDAASLSNFSRVKLDTFLTRHQLLD
jgi:mycoredoxin